MTKQGMSSDIVVDDLCMDYGDVQALQRINLGIDSGELFGLIGPDGAGKTSLLRILVSLLVPTRGTARVGGLDVVADFWQLRKILGYMPGRFSLYKDLSVRENLQFFASIFGTTIAENYDLVADIYRQIEPFSDRRAGDLSGGMKQKLALSCALIHRPRVLILDEPTTGVDAVSREELWDMLIRLKQEGITIVVSTPYMDEASLCDRVALIQKGRLLKIDTPASVEQSYSHPLFAIRDKRQYVLLDVLRSKEYARAVFAFGDALHYTDSRPSVDAGIVKSELAASGFPDAEVVRTRPGIEDVFMELMDSKTEA